MTEMVERVAVAIWVARGDYPDSATGVRIMWDNLKHDLMTQAEAAIEAMCGIDWTPSAENINALPEPLRKFIHALATDADPQGTIRENFILRDENKLLRLECERLAKK